MPEARRRIRLAVDIGGTFTDGVAEESPGGRIWVGKCLTTPEDPGQAVMTVIADLLRQVAASLGGSAAGVVAEVVHGTTLVANAIIERRGARTGLIVTRGTRDVPEIGREMRYDLYDLHLEMPRALVPPDQRLEVDARHDADGGEIAPLEEPEIARLVDAIRQSGAEAVAICLLHAYANDAHETRIGAALRQALPGLAISLSSDVAREIREFERMSTTAANAYVQPVMARYLDSLAARLGGLGLRAQLRIMVSSGGFTSSERAAKVPIQLLESGPAGGVLSAINTARGAGVADLLAFDMGGTTAKACVARGGKAAVTHLFETARVRRFRKGSGLPMLVPSIELIEIGAGGGSIAEVGPLGLLKVGPESAGSMPGPACYGLGGTAPTVTDADLALGYLDPGNFLGGEMPLRTDLADAALDRLGARLGTSRIDTAFGIADLVNETMAAAARVHIAEHGLDPRRLTMVATGGAGPAHAVEVAAKLGIRELLCTIAAGAGSCLGFLAAPARVDRSWSYVMDLDAVKWADVARAVGRLHADALAELAGVVVGTGGIRWTLGVEMRFAGQGNSVEIALPYGPIGPALAEDIRKRFYRRCRDLFGRVVPKGRPEVVTWRLTGAARVTHRRFAIAGQDALAATAAPSGQRRIYLSLRRAFAEAPVYARAGLPPGAELKAPLLIQERESTIVVARPGIVRILPDRTVSIRLDDPSR